VSREDGDPICDECGGFVEDDSELCADCDLCEACCECEGGFVLDLDEEDCDEDDDFEDEEDED
jgi:hypothetical protein